MFTIYGGKTEFKQWDLGQKVVNPNMCDCEQVVFRMSNGDSDVSRAYEFEGQMVADVPNELLTRSGRMMVNLGQGQNLRMSETTYFDVVKADKPDGYVCTDNRNLKKKYLETTEQTLTDAEKAQVRKNIGAGEGTGGGGVTDYNKLENKPVGAEKGETVILPEITVEIEPESGSGMFANVADVKVGNVYTVTWNGTEYFCEAVLQEVDFPIICLGNISAMTGGTPTAEPFVLMFLAAETAASAGFGGAVMSLDGSASATLSVNDAIVYPLAPMYLRKMVVNFTQVNENARYNAVADKTLEEITDAVHKGYDVVGKITMPMGSNTLTVVLSNISLTVNNEKNRTDICVFSMYYSDMIFIIEYNSAAHAGSEGEKTPVTVTFKTIT